MKLVKKVQLFFYSLLLLLAAQTVLTAQTGEKINTVKLMHQGEEALYNENFEKAIEAYQKLVDNVEESKGYFSFLLGISYVHSSIDVEKGLEYIEFAKSELSESEIAETYYYHLGRAYHLNERFIEAKEAFTKAMEFEKDREDLIEELEYYLACVERCLNDNEFLDIRLVSIGDAVNSEYRDYKPVISADESRLIFTSRRAGGTTGKMETDIDGKYFEDIYITDKDAFGYFRTPKGISSNINSPYHEASVGLSPDGTELLIYKGDPHLGGLFVSKFDGSNWSIPENIDINNLINGKKSWETSGSISSSKNVMYFTTNRKGSFGGLDIYKIERNEDNTWKTPENLGSIINTEYDEESPFIHPDGKTLYFSSKGHAGLGGFDVYKSVYEGNTWSAPVRLGQPINSVYDDVHFVLSADGTKGYFSSSRMNGFGREDIYKVYLQEDVAPLIVVKGKVVADDYPIEVDIKIIRKSDNEVQKFVDNPNPQTGSYLMILPPGEQYTMLVNAEGYQTYALDLDIPISEEYHEYYQEIVLKKLKAFGNELGEQVYVVNSFDDLRKQNSLDSSMRLANSDHLYDLVQQIAKMETGFSEQDKANNPALAAKLYELNRLTDNITEGFDKLVEAKAITDHLNNTFVYLDKDHQAALSQMIIGNDTFMVVSQDKFKSTDLAMKDQTQYDISENDLTLVEIDGKQYYSIDSKKVNNSALKSQQLTPAIQNGDTVYLLTNAMINEPEIAFNSDNVAKRAKSNSAGKPIEVAPASIADNPIVNTDKKSSPKETPPDLLMEKVINFGFDKFIFNDQFRTSLDSIVEALKSNYNYIAVIEGHTDNVGDEKYNLDLSRRRALEVVNYINARGIKKSRLKMEYFGEEKPIAPNVFPDGSDNIEGRKLNRRTLVRVEL